LRPNKWIEARRTQNNPYLYPSVNSLFQDGLEQESENLCLNPRFKLLVESVVAETARRALGKTVA
jgi:hypothetical protein